MYTQSPRATDSRAEGVHIRQTMSAYGIIVICVMAPPTGEHQAAQAPEILHTASATLFIRKLIRIRDCNSH